MRSSTFNTSMKPNGIRLQKETLYQPKTAAATVHIFQKGIVAPAGNYIIIRDKQPTIFYIK